MPSPESSITTPVCSYAKAAGAEKVHTKYLFNSCQNHFSASRYGWNETLSRSCAFMWLMGSGYRVVLGGRAWVHCKKSLTILPSPAGMSLTKLSLAENTWQGTEKSPTFFYSVLIFYASAPSKQKPSFIPFYDLESKGPLNWPKKHWRLYKK
jgi:hypothetical protein